METNKVVCKGSVLLFSCYFIKPQILYRKKLHTVYPMLYKPKLKNSKN